MTYRVRRTDTGSNTAAWRVGVTGFLDWPATREEAAGFDRWRCQSNPSGLLLTGERHPGGTPPGPRHGPLPRLLSAISRTRDRREVEWHFQLLPVLWGIANEIDADAFDAVVNLGLGVYDANDRLWLERGAFNRRARQCDAAGVVPMEDAGPGEVIDSRHGRIIDEPPGRTASLEALAGILDGTGYRLDAMEARESNAYVCNETHAIMLGRLGGGHRLARADFIHLPRPRDDDGLHSLAQAVARVIERLALP